MDNWNTIKKIIAIVLFIALLPITAFNVILVCLTFAWTQYLKTLILFIPSLLLLLWAQRVFWRMFRGRQAAKPTTERGLRVVRCRCCGGSNTVSGTRLGKCKYCSVKL